ncbi:unnamed protein product [Lupinus luteus]|uniref:Reverse transcriptase n=1 Tax=Lupinus luteus TaxID=3873 RepID=A0AAV1WLE8_LUPLU
MGLPHNPSLNNGGIPFKLTFGTKTMIPVEIGESTWCIKLFMDDNNSDQIRNNLDLIEELRDKAQIREAAVKERTTKTFNNLAVPREFKEDSLVLRMVDVGKAKGKLAPKWEGPYRVKSKFGH